MKLLSGVSFIIKNILLHDSGKAAVSGKMLLYQSLADPGLGKVFGEAAFGGVPVHEDLPDPCVHRKGVDVVEAEETDAVGHLFTDAVKAGEIIHGVLIGQRSKMGKIQPSAACILADPFDIFGAVAQLHGNQILQRCGGKLLR